MEGKNKKRQIAFVNQSAGYLMLDIVDAFKDTYSERILLAGFINPRNKTIDNTITIKKLVAYNRTSSVKRLLTWTVAFLQALWLIKTRYRKADLFLVSNPPFAILIPLFCKNPYRILVYDVYPDALITYKMIGPNSSIARWWKNANKRIFLKAEGIYTIGKGMKQLLCAYTADENIKLVPVWTDNKFLKPINKSENPFLKKHDLQDKFIVLYSGNLGKTQDVEVLVDLAGVVNDEQLFFLIIGSGDRAELIRERIKEEALKNILWLPWQETDQLPFTLAAADIAVVSLGKEASLLSVPSKTFNYLSVGAPLLCIASKNSELAELVNEYDVGKCFETTNIGGMLEFITDLKRNKDEYASYSSRSLRTSRLFSPLNANEFI